MDYDARANNRVDIENDGKLKLHLQDWEDEKKQQNLSIEFYRGRCNAVKTELYQLMGFYSVFEGVVFQAVAQASRLTCQTSLNPALLSVLASIATAISVHSKLTYYENEKLKLMLAQAVVAKNLDKINMLKAAGKAFNFKTAETQDSAKETYQKQILEDEKKSLGRIYWAVMTFLAIFSVIILASCVIVLCWDPDKNILKLCLFAQCWVVGKAS